MAREFTFHGDLLPVTLYVGGQPLSVQGEVSVTIKRPAKLSAQDNRVWDQATKESVEAIGVVAPAVR